MKEVRGFCRPNGQRRVTRTCNPGGQTYVCRNEVAAPVNCELGCRCPGPTGCSNPCLLAICGATGGSTGGATGCSPAPSYKVCEFAPRPQTYLEACNPRIQGRWTPVQSKTYDRCGQNCATCTQTYICSRLQCDPALRPPDTQWTCDAPLCSNVSPVCIAPPNNNVAMSFTNQSAKPVYIRLQYTVAYAGGLQPWVEITGLAIAVNTTAVANLPKYLWENGGERWTVEAGWVSELASDQPFVVIVTGRTNIQQQKQSLFFNTFTQVNPCIALVFTDNASTSFCSNIPFPKPVLAPVDTFFGRFLRGSPNALEVLDGAEITFQQADQANRYLYTLASADNKGTRITGFKVLLVTGPNPTPPEYRFKLVQEGSTFALLDQYNNRVKINNGKTESSSFALSFTNDRKFPDQKDLVVGVSFFTTANPGNPTTLLSDAPPLPMLPNNVNFGVDNAILRVLSLRPEVAESLLQNDPRRIVGCCVGTGPVALCNGTRFNPDSRECEDFMRDVWCQGARTRDLECACFPREDRTLDELIARFAEGGDIANARVCTVPSCKPGVGAFLPRPMRQAECGSVCSQIQTAINNGKATNIDFTGIQEMYCGGNAKYPIRPPSK